MSFLLLYHQIVPRNSQINSKLIESCHHASNLQALTHIHTYTHPHLHNTHTRTFTHPHLHPYLHLHLNIPALIQTRTYTTHSSFGTFFIGKFIIRQFLHSANFHPASPSFGKFFIWQVNFIRQVLYLAVSSSSQFLIRPVN